MEKSTDQVKRHPKSYHWYSNLCFLLALMILFGLTLFRADWFVINDIAPWVFKGIVLTQFLFLCLIIAHWATLNRWIPVVLCLLLEGLLYAGSQRVAAGHRLMGSRFIQHMCLVWHENLIQFDTTLSQFDAELFYTLKPSIQNQPFRSGHEINASISTNSLGLRDTEAALSNPDIIFLGDSFTMGWGVEKQDCFTDIIAGKLGVKALNTGISSYGTAREFRLLKRIKSTSCKLLVIQYCTNDVVENDQFVSGNMKHGQAAQYEQAVRINRLTADYYPFKYCFSLTGILLSDVSEWVSKLTENEQSDGNMSGKLSEEECFFRILNRIRHIYQGPILITYIDGSWSSPGVIPSFTHYVQKHSLENVYVVDVLAGFSAVDYFKTDMHINKEGHRKIADKLHEFIRAHKLIR